MISRRTLFLDKDGVINVDHGYVCTPQRTDFIDGIFDLCKCAGEYGWLVVVVTNQAGIARGYYTEQQFLDYMDWVRGQFETHKARLDAVYYCPHHPVHGLGRFRSDCECRKPKPGMLLAAQREWGVDMAQSLLLGDKENDLEAGVAAQVGRSLMVRVTTDVRSHRVAYEESFMQEVRVLLRQPRAGTPFRGEQ